VKRFGNLLLKSWSVTCLALAPFKKPVLLLSFWWVRFCFGFCPWNYRVSGNASSNI